MTSIRVASSQHIIEPATHWKDYAMRATEQVSLAAAAQAKLLVFAEYGSMALVTVLPPAQRLTLQGQLAGLQVYAQEFVSLYQSLARQFGVWIVAPSFPFAINTSHYVNRAWITGPAGELFHQDKIHMTRFEKELFFLSPGNTLKIINTGTFHFASAICYDSEFPDLVHQLARGGAQIIAIPSCTDSLAGYHRVHYCARARAVENQCFVVQAPLRGEAPWCEAIDINIGTAGIFSPIDHGFPEDGVLAQGLMHENWVLAECDLDSMENVRQNGQVLNWRDRKNAYVLPIMIETAL